MKTIYSTKNFSVVVIDDETNPHLAVIADEKAAKQIGDLHENTVARFFPQSVEEVAEKTTRAITVADAMQAQIEITPPAKSDKAAIREALNKAESRKK